MDLKLSQACFFPNIVELNSQPPKTNSVCGQSRIWTRVRPQVPNPIVRLRNEIMPGGGYTGNDLYFLLTKRCVTWRLTMSRNCHLYNEVWVSHCLHKFNTWLIHAVFWSWLLHFFEVFLQTQVFLPLLFTISHLLLPNFKTCSSTISLLKWSHTSFVLVMFIFPQCLNFLCHAAFKRSSWISLTYLFKTVWYHENF